MMSSTTNVLLAGVGGQGTIFAGKVLSSLLLGQGMDVKMSEVHGMAQRGGSVVTHVRYGQRVLAPTITPGQADFMLAFEQMEALRMSHWLAPVGVIVANTRRIPSLPILIGAERYPEDVPERLAQKGLAVHWIDAFATACELGSARVENTVLLGAFSTVLPFAEGVWIQAISSTSPAVAVDLNIKAFIAGRKLM